MIGRIAGTLLEKNPPQILVDVGGVGYELEAPMSTIFEPSEMRVMTVFTSWGVSCWASSRMKKRRAIERPRMKQSASISTSPLRMSRS